MIRSIPLILVISTNISIIYILFGLEIIYSFETVFLHWIYQLWNEFPVNIYNNFKKLSSNSNNQSNNNDIAVISSNDEVILEIDNSAVGPSQRQQQQQTAITKLQPNNRGYAGQSSLLHDSSDNNTRLETPSMHKKSHRGDRGSISSNNSDNSIENETKNENENGSVMDILQRQLTHATEKQAILYEKVKLEYIPSTKFSKNEWKAGINCLIGGILGIFSVILICKSIQNFQSKNEFIRSIIGVFIRYFVSIILLIVYVWIEKEKNSINNINHRIRYNIWIYLVSIGLIATFPYFYFCNKNRLQLQLQSKS